MANTKVTAKVIADGTITATQIANDAVTGAKIEDNVALAGSPTTTTQSASDNSTKIATTAYVETAVTNLVDSAPSALNTLNELAAALGDDASFSTTVTNSIATKLPLAGGTMTGNIAHASNFTIDVGGTLTLDADDGVIDFDDAGTNIGRIENASSDFKLEARVQDKDIVLVGNDGGTGVEALRLDMSDAGSAFFNNDAYIDKYLRLRTTDDQTNAWLLYTNTNDSLEFNYNGSGNAEVVIDNSGNMGVGDTAPFSKLHVEDTGWSSGSPYGTVAYIEGGGVNDLNWGHLVVSQSGTTTDTGGRISLGANGQNPIAGIRAKYKGATYGDLAFLTRPSGGTNTERMLITSAGAVEMYQSLLIAKTVTGANDQEMLTIMRDGGSTSDGARQASIAFFDGNNDTYVGKISGYRDSPAGNYDGGLRFYVNPHATNANATFAELNNTPALYMNPDQSSTFQGQAIIGQSTSAIGNYTSNNSGHTTLNYGKIGHQYNSTGTIYTFGTYTHPSAMYGFKTDGSTASWNRLLWINHRASYMITIWTSGGWYGPTAHTVKVDTNYSNAISVKTISEGTAGSYSYAIRFTAPDAGTGGGWLDFQNTGGSSGGTAYSGIYISVTPLRGTDFVFASLKSEAAGDTISTLSYTATKTNASDY
jgi:hypothetical protein